MRSLGVNVASDDASSLGGSRRGSDSSDALGKQREELRKIMSKGHGDVNAPVGGSQGAPLPVSLPFDEGETKLTLRTRGLRENAAR
jgi:UV radiation resistance-associated gene protein